MMSLKKAPTSPVLRTSPSPSLSSFADDSYMLRHEGDGEQYGTAVHETKIFSFRSFTRRGWASSAARWTFDVSRSTMGWVLLS
jgi:hypothetical protein